MNKVYIIAVAGVFLVGSAYLLAGSNQNDVTSVAATTHAKKQVKKRKGPSRWFKSADTDKDGKLSNKEFHAAHEKYFQKVDSNRDGAITPKEIRENRAKRRGKKSKNKKSSR